LSFSAHAYNCLPIIIPEGITLLLKHVAVFFGAILTLTTVVYADQAEERDKPLQIDFVISEPCSLVRFVNTISSGNHSVTWLKDWFFRKRESSASPDVIEKDKALCHSYRVLMDDNSCKYKDQTGRQLDLYQEILCLASRTSSLPELLDKIKGIAKDADFQTLKSVFEYFDPMYRQLIWEPRLKSLERQLAEFKEKTVKLKIAERLGRVQSFMKAPWVPGLPFTVVLVPLPGGNNHTSGEGLGAVQIVELLPEGKFKTSAGVVFHEDCHGLWRSKNDLPVIQKMFASLPTGKIVYTELNEAMATALGQGWFMHETFGKSDKSWYRSDWIINTNSHALLPLLSDYLKNGTSMDSAFAKQACTIFNNKFPNAAVNVEFTSTYVILADNIPDITEFKSSVQEFLFRLHDFSLQFPLDDKHVKQFNEVPSEHKAILISVDKLNLLSGLDLSSKQIAILKKAVNQTVTMNLNDSEVLFCMAESPNEQQKLLLSVLSKKKWPATEKDGVSKL
jgi:hypothetical protein